MKKFLPLLFLSLNLSLMQMSYAEKVPYAKGAELSLHRLERLVVLKKIDETYQSKFRSLFLEVLDQRNAGEPYYKITIGQYPAADRSIRKLILEMDEEGKTLKHTVEGTQNGIEAPAWPDKDPVTLSENSLHFVLEEAEKNNLDILPFHNGLKSFEISSLTHSDGSKKASVKMRSSLTTKVLEVIMNLDGTFNSHKFQ